MFGKLKAFFNESRQELRHVNWPTRQEAAKLTAMVVAFALALALYLGLFDSLFSYLLRTFVLKT